MAQSELICMDRIIFEETCGLTGRFIHGENDSRIFVLESALEKPTPKADVLIISPFGKSVHDCFIAAYYLTLSGFNVIRFDPLNHVGMSTGEISNFTLSQLERDVDAVLELRSFPARPLILVGISLSAPVAWKLASLDRRVSGVATLVGVVDVADTIAKASGSSVVQYRDPNMIGDTYQQIFGFKILAQPFVTDMDANGYGSFRDTQRYLENIPVPAHMIAATNDQYVDINQVKALASSLPQNSHFILLENASHEIGRSLAATKQALLTLTSLCLLSLGVNRKAEELSMPKFTDVIKSSSVESDYLSKVSEMLLH
jgi:acyl transferase